MLYVVCSVRDRATDLFSRPMFLASLGQAIRVFSDEVNRNADNNVLWTHPEDHDLYELGTFDDHTGAFECKAPRQIAIGKDVRVTKK